MSPMSMFFMCPGGWLTSPHSPFDVCRCQVYLLVIFTLNWLHRQAAEDAFREACAAEERAKKMYLSAAQQYLSSGQCPDLREFVFDAVRLEGMPQLNRAHFGIVEGEDVPDMVKAMVEQEANMNCASEDVGKNEARLAGIQSGKSHLPPGQAIEDVETNLEKGMFHLRMKVIVPLCPSN
jgi:hypothetical protein